MKKLILFAAVAAAAVSCVPQRMMYRESSGRNIEPSQGAVVTPLLADLELVSDTKQTHVENTGCDVTPDIIAQIDNYKNMALLNAAKKFDADTMVAAIINVDTDADGKLVITVTGYPARYVNFRTMTEKDAWISNVTAKREVPIIESGKTTERKSGFLGLF